MKILCGIISIIICTFIGYRMSSKYSEKRKFYNSFSSFNKKLLYEVTFTKNSLVRILKNYNEKNDDFICVLKNKYLLNAKQPAIKYKYLADDENEFFMQYVESIGTGDSESQSVFLTGADKYLDNRLSSSTENEKKYKSLYIKLGFMTGLVVFIILL